MDCFLKDDNTRLTPRQIDIYRAMPAWRKLELVAQFNHAARELKAAALRAQYPDWGEEQVRAKVRDIFLHAAG